MGSALPADLHHNLTVATLQLSGPVGPVLTGAFTSLGGVHHESPPHAYFG